MTGQIKADKMFTGIIEEIGTVRSIYGGSTGAVLDIEAGLVLDGTCKGGSIAVNGVCLTVSPGRGHFTADAMPETLRRTSLGRLRPGSKVNLERAMLCGGRFGGHMVSGHVDACGEILSMTRDGIATLMRISAPYEILIREIPAGDAPVQLSSAFYENRIYSCLSEFLQQGIYICPAVRGGWTFHGFNAAPSQNLQLL